jgi:hypothetical protein
MDDKAIMMIGNSSHNTQKKGSPSLGIGDPS